MLTRLPYLAYRKIRRGFLRLYPQATLDLAFAGRPYPKGLTRLGNYAAPEILESKGIIPDRPVTHSFHARDYYVVENPVVDPSMGEIYLESGEFIIQSTPWHPYVPYPERRPPFFRPKRLSNKEGFIRIPSWTYYHQVVENLPPLLFLKKMFPEAIVLVPESGLKLAGLILDDLGIPYIPFRGPTSVNRLFFVGHGRDSGYPHSRDIELLKEAVLPVAQNRPSRQSLGEDIKAVYISRLGSERSPINEGELIEQLRLIDGVLVVESEKQSFLDQVSLFSKANAIIGVHGAGLTNQIWMKPQSKVFELIDSGYSNPVFESLAALCNHEHQGIFMDEGQDKGPCIDIAKATHLISNQLSNL